MADTSQGAGWWQASDQKWYPPEQAPADSGRVRWQYRIIALGAFFAGDRMASAFAELGEAGWELVTIYDKSSSWIAGMESGFALFKRPVQPGERPEGPWAEVSVPFAAQGSVSVASASATSETEMAALLADRGIDVPGAASALAGVLPLVEGVTIATSSSGRGVIAMGGGHYALWAPDMASVVTGEVAATFPTYVIEGYDIILTRTEGSPVTVHPMKRSHQPVWVKLLQGYGIGSS